MGKNAGKNAEKNSANKVPRPKNCFILFRLDMQNKVSEMCPGANHRDISRIIAKWWREASDSEHEYYQELAKQEKIEHAKMYPNYKYNP
ncbi:HMG-box, partial [Backusella circina FSU 941]